ncbi:uncharacterized protein ATNIH1004_009432 [Aspergillus tanneri]|uniref:Uncharacterized protein n=1 Tax=Aspergillus tanneri TaxID=1220188 RepID=A0A5M9ME24_9EURO|nr:uncharacterized protein ATNIH1004_009432 [Aspergillus tanneri]KAA8645215.1 hypothetical protein ATNIH1004_009432 [Aspergillus tanneri]
MATRRTSVAFPDGSQPPPLLTYLKEYNSTDYCGSSATPASDPSRRYPRSSHDEFSPLPNSSSRIPELELHDLWECSHCGHLTRSQRISKRHQVAAAHRADGLPWAPRRVQGQSWFQSSRYLRFWTTAPVDHGRPASMPVETTEDPPSSSAADTILIGEPEIAPSQLDPVTEDNRRIKPNELPVRPLRPLAPKPVDAEPIERPTTPLQTPPLTGNHTARWIREIQHLEARGIHRQHPAQEARPDPRLFVFQARHMEDDVTPWLLQTDWLRFLDGRYLRVLAEASAPDPGRLQSHPGLQSFWPGALWDDKELVPDEPAGSIQQMSVNILDLVIASFDRVLNRALDSLASTHPPIRRLFRSSSQTGLSAVELDRQQPKTLQRYRRVWRRYLAWMVRGAPLTDQERTEILGLRLDKYEREHLTRIWDTLQAYLAHPEETLAAGHFLQRMEQTDARRQAVKRAYDRSNLGELAAISSPVPTPQTTSSTTTANSRAGTAAVRKRPRRESVTPTPLPPPMRRGHRRTASQARLLTPTKASGTRLRDPRVGGSVSTGENSPVPSPRRVERMVAVCIPITPPLCHLQTLNPLKPDTASEPAWLGSPGHIPGEISDTDLTSSDWSDEEEEDFLTSTESPIPSMGDGADLDRRAGGACLSFHRNQTGNKFDSSLVALTAVLAIHPVHLTVAGPYSYTSDLAAILWISRLLLLEYALPAKPYHFINDVPVRDQYRNRVRRAAAVHYTFGVRHTFYPLEEILRLTAHGIYQMYHEVRPASITWSPDQETVYYRQNPTGYTMTNFRHWIQHLIHTTTDFFNRELLLGYVEDFTLADLVDVPISTVWRAAASAGFDTLGYPGHAIVTWGQTSREKELLTIKWQNTATSQRNIFLSNGQVMIVTEYHKTRRRTVRTHPVARFLPSAVGRLLVTYLIHVRPMLVAFNIDSAVFNSAYLTTLSYRHLSIAIAKKHLRPQMTGSDLQSAETVLHNILAAQAGHHSHINNQIYAVEDTYPLGSPSQSPRSIPARETTTPRHLAEVNSDNSVGSNKQEYGFIGFEPIPQLKVIVCRRCRYAVRPDEVERHLKSSIIYPIGQ